ncbi:MAG: hypothetical protein QXG79_04070 [Saccharolobus sp.]
MPGLYVENESFNYIKFRVQDNLTINLNDEMKNFLQKLLTLLEDLEKIINNKKIEQMIYTNHITRKNSFDLPKRGTIPANPICDSNA